MKYRETPCKYYESHGNPCELGYDDADLKGSCQHCKQYKARSHTKLSNRKKKKIEDIKEREFQEELKDI